ncbi:MAG: hypothetical protein J0I17_13470 ['Candidatus Kapabacteria' thiocyanatum]|nr:hypothetical protein ['Candidatus Kapabacteria' thiocyanatum]
MKLTPEETELVGQWITENGQVRGDSVCDRIQWLTSSYLHRIAYSKTLGAWETLFQDPEDGRYWELTYPNSGMHGGGPQALIHISRSEAKTKYGDEAVIP